jgi:hypothetical protein
MSDATMHPQLVQRSPLVDAALRAPGAFYLIWDGALPRVCPLHRRDFGACSNHDMLRARACARVMGSKWMERK